MHIKERGKGGIEFAFECRPRQDPPWCLTLGHVCSHKRFCVENDWGPFGAKECFLRAPHPRFRRDRKNAGLVTEAGITPGPISKVQGVGMDPCTVTGLRSPPKGFTRGRNTFTPHTDNECTHISFQKKIPHRAVVRKSQNASYPTFQR